ncbi:hypothetical protein [Shewanella algae]|uniref:hypothetical protein n=1 Tax=Shewanella algae TaxID=38313 RepID=UPI0031F5AAA8
MNDYLIFHRRQFYLERNWLIKANTPQRPVEYGPDLVVDFASALVCSLLNLSPTYSRQWSLSGLSVLKTPTSRMKICMPR